MRYERIGTVQTTLYDSLGEIADAMAALPGFAGDNPFPSPYPIAYSLFGDWGTGHEGRGNAMRYIGRPFKNMADVRKACDTMWPEGMRIYDEMMKELMEEPLPQPKSLRRHAAWSDDGGDEVDLQRLQRGQPFWRTSRRDHRPGPAMVTILTEMSTPYFVNPINVLWRGAAGILLTEILEKAGYRVELWAVACGLDVYTNGDGKCLAVKLKNPHDPLDVSTLINAVSGWAYRCLDVAGSHLSPTHRNQVRRTYGHPCSIEVMVPYITPDSQAFIAEQIWSANDAITWVRARLEEIMKK